MNKRTFIKLLAVVAVLAVAAVANAFFSSDGTGTASATVGDMTAPSLTAPASSTGPVSLTWTASTVTPTGHDADVTYTVARNDGSGFTPAGGTCAGTLTSSTLACSETLGTDGSYTYRVTAHFNSWSASDSKTVAVDGTAPTVQSSVRADADNTNASTVSWTVTFSESVTGVDTSDFSLTTSGVGGTPALQSVTPLSGSVYTVTASTGTGSGSIRLDLTDDDSITDGAGNALGGPTAGDGDFTAGDAYTIDRTAPQTNATGNDANWHNADVTVHLAATDSGGSGVETLHYKVDGGTQQDISGDNTDVTINAPSDHSNDGQHSIEFWSTDAAGNDESPRGSATVKIDTVNPSTSPSGNDANWHNAAVNVTLTGSDSGAPTTGSGVQTVHYIVDGGTQQDISATSTIVNVPAPSNHTNDGQHGIEFWSTDAAGNNESPHTTVTVKIDTRNPTTTPSGNDSAWHNTAVGVGLNASDAGAPTTGSGVQTLHYTVDGGTQQNVAGAGGTASTTVNIPAPANHSNDGTHTISFFSTDAAGNNETAHQVTVKIDTTGPTATVTLSNASGAFLSAGTLYYKGDAAGSTKISTALTDAGAGAASVSYPDISTIGWTHAAETVNGTTPYLSQLFSWTASPSNPTTYTITSSDAIGNTTTTNISFQSDTTAPTGGTISYTDGFYKALSVPITTTAWTDGGSGVGSTTIQRDEASLSSDGTCGSFPNTFGTNVTLVGNADTSVANGKCYKYRVFATDNLGNVSTPATSASIAKVDTTAPAITAIASQQSAGTAGDGQLQNGDKLILAFNEHLSALTTTSFTGASLTRGGNNPATLTIPNITNGTNATGSSGYLAGSGSKSATFSGTVGLVNNVGGTATVTITVSSLAGDPTAASAGIFAFRPAANAFRDLATNANTAGFDTVNTFKLF